MAEEKAGGYRAYLLRCWQEAAPSPAGKPAWRFSLEEILGDRRRRGFSRLQDLLAFLATELADHENKAAGEQ